MPKVPGPKFEAAIKSGAAAKDRKPVYLLFGLERKKVEDAAFELKAALAPSMGESENHFRYSSLGAGPDDADAQDVVAQLNTVSMFGGGKLALLGPLPSLNKAAIETLAAYAANPNELSTLIVAVAPPKGEGRAIAGLEKSALAAETARAGVVVHFAAPKEADVRKWVAEKFVSYDLSIAPDAAELLIELCGNDLEKLDGEIQKLSGYAAGKDKVTRGDVETSAGDWRLEKIWDFTRAFGARDLPAAQGALLNLMDNNTPAQVIVKSLAREIARIAAAADQRRSGGSMRSFSEEMGEGQFMLRDSWTASAGWSLGAAHGCLKNLLETSVDIMRGGASAETALMAFLLDSLKPAKKANPASRAGHGAARR